MGETGRNGIARQSGVAVALEATAPALGDAMVRCDRRKGDHHECECDRDDRPNVVDVPVRELYCGEGGRPAREQRGFDRYSAKQGEQRPESTDSHG
jgi:hypothetical protein